MRPVPVICNADSSFQRHYEDLHLNKILTRSLKKTANGTPSRLPVLTTSSRSPQAWRQALLLYLFNSKSTKKQLCFKPVERASPVISEQILVLDGNGRWGVGGAGQRRQRRGLSLPLHRACLGSEGCLAPGGPSSGLHQGGGETAGHSPRRRAAPGVQAKISPQLAQPGAKSGERLLRVLICFLFLSRVKVLRLRIIWAELLKTSVADPYSFFADLGPV